MYADDIVLYSSHRNPRMAIRNIQVDLNCANEWCHNNCMTINEKKTQTMWYASDRMRKDLPDLELKIGNKIRAEVNHYIYLGVDLDSDLTLATYVNNTTSKMSSKVFKLSKIRPSLTEGAAISVYKQAVLPLADYCCFLAESARRNPTQQLQVIQNQALRICLKG